MTWRTLLALVPITVVAFIASLLLPTASFVALLEDDPPLAFAVLTELRLPRALLALVYGASLGASGAAICCGCRMLPPVG